MHETTRRRISALLAVLIVFFLAEGIYFLVLGSYVVAALAGLAALNGLMVVLMARSPGRNGPAPALTFAYLGTLAVFLIALWRTLSTSG